MAYLNVDVAVGGSNIFIFMVPLSKITFLFLGNQTFYGDAYPTLKKLIIEMSKLVPNPSNAEVAAGRTKVFDTWLANDPDPENLSQPRYTIYIFN